jgi:dephospho-CoA kinase
MTSRKRKNTISIGITGGIGCGKTEVCNILRILGAKVFFADMIAKEIVNKQSDVRKRIQKTFGKNVYTADGSLDRKKVAKIVFDDGHLKKALDKIVHPYVIEILKKQIQKAKDSGIHSLVVVEAALIYEVGVEKMFDYIVMIDASEEERIRRVMQRDNVTRVEVVKRIKMQMPVEQKIRRADFVIYNTDDMRKLETSCRFFFNLMTQLANQQSCEVH